MRIPKKVMAMATAVFTAIELAGGGIHAQAAQMPAADPMEAARSLAELGVHSPYYDPGQPRAMMYAIVENWEAVKFPLPNGYDHWPYLYNEETGEFDLQEEAECDKAFNWIDFSQYDDIADPYWGLSLLCNHKNAAYPEATPSKNVINNINSSMMWDTYPDASGASILVYPLESAKITQEEVDALPVLPVVNQWVDALWDLATDEEFLGYAQQVSELIEAHAGTYTSVTELWPAQPGLNGHPSAKYEDSFGRDRYFNIDLNYRFYMSDCMWPNFSLDFQQHWEKSNWSPRQVRIVLKHRPNELDLKVIQSVLHRITPDGEAIYQAIRAEWEDPLGYGPWKYWDKWYDIGETSRVRTWRELKNEKYENEDTLNPRLTYGITNYYYDIAPRDDVIPWDPYYLDTIDGVWYQRELGRISY